MTLLYPCATCPHGLVENRNASCVRCIAAFEAEFNPIDRHATTPKRLTRWQRRAIRRRFLRAVKNYEWEILP